MTVGFCGSTRRRSDADWSSLHKSLGIIGRAESISAEQRAGGSDAPIAAKYKDVFEGLGLLPGEHHIKTKKDAQPMIQAARRVPFKYRHQLQQQLKEMV